MPPKKAAPKKVKAKKATAKRVSNKKVVLVPVMVHKGQKGGAWYDDLADGFKAGASLGMSFL